MQNPRRVRYGSLLIIIFAVLSPSAFAQQVIATIPVGVQPEGSAVNPVTNKIYVTNYCGNDFRCASNGTVTVIDGATNNTVSVNVGAAPYAVAVNSVTNKIYVANMCGNDVWPCTTLSGTVTVIDGATLATEDVTVGKSPYAVAVNSVTNKIYVANICGNDVSCRTQSGTVTVIDGATLATTTVAVGASPSIAVVNPVTNKIYVTNNCGNDPTSACGWLPFSPGTVTVIDGVNNDTVSRTKGQPTAGGGGIVAAVICNVNLVGHRVNHRDARTSSYGNGRGGKGRAVNYRHRPALGPARDVVAADVGNVDLIRHGVHCHRVGRLPDGNILGGKGRAVNYRHRPAKGRARPNVVAAHVGNVDLIRHRVHCHRVGSGPHTDRDGIVGRSVDDGHCPIARTAEIVTRRVICHVDLIGHWVHR